jgi:conjugative transfer region protein (TIGR03748 family)
MKIFKAIVICLTISSSLAEAANVTQTNRYATVENKPLAAQINPLLTVQQMHFPQQVVSVGDAIRYWMQYSGYKLANDTQLPSAFKNLMSQPLPQVQRNLGPLTIKDGLKVLAGIDVFTLIQNPLTRTITFRLSPVRGHSA